MPLSVNDAFMYENPDLFPGFEQQPFYESILYVGKFYNLGTEQYSHLERLFQNIKIFFPNMPDENEWVDSLLSHLLEKGGGFEFCGLADLLKFYAQIDKVTLYKCLEQTAKELCGDNFDELRIIFNGKFDSFGFFGYIPGPKGDAILSESLFLGIKPRPEDNYKTVIDGVIEDVTGIRDEIRHRIGIDAIGEEGIITDDTLSVVSSLITGRIHLLIPISERKATSINKRNINYPTNTRDDQDEIPF